jgi:hypothetical protein
MGFKSHRSKIDCKNETYISKEFKKSTTDHLLTVRGGLGPKSLRRNRIYKGHKGIVKKASHRFEKPFIPQKMFF